MQYLIVLVVWIVAAYFLARFADAYIAPDACLDAGGSFDYAAWLCSHETNHSFISVGISHVPGFWPLAASLLLALGSSAYVLRGVRG